MTLTVYDKIIILLHKSDIRKHKTFDLIKNYDTEDFYAKKELTYFTTNLHPELLTKLHELRLINYLNETLSLNNCNLLPMFNIPMLIIFSVWEELTIEDGEKFPYPLLFSDIEDEIITLEMPTTGSSNKRCEFICNKNNKHIKDIEDYYTLFDIYSDEDKVPTNLGLNLKLSTFLTPEYKNIEAVRLMDLKAQEFELYKYLFKTNKYFLNIYTDIIIDTIKKQKDNWNTTTMAYKNTENLIGLLSFFTNCSKDFNTKKGIELNSDTFDSLHNTIKRII